MADEYFSEDGQCREALLWVVAVRIQLDRWEPLVARNLRDKLPGELVWRAQIEHHFAIVAARHLIRVAELFDFGVEVDSLVASEVREARDLLEHWDENMPVFNVSPRPRAPGWPSGRDFAERNPGRSPYAWLNYHSPHGPLLTPNVSAFALRDVADRMEVAALERCPQLAEYVPAPAATEPIWVWNDKSGWWPRPDLGERRDADT